MQSLFYRFNQNKLVHNKLQILGLSEIRLNSINPPSIANNSINDDIKKYMFLKQVWRNINQLQYGKTFLMELYL